ncbi:MAG TPA: hypothetical protein VH415_06155 [Nitrososphaeraceae archaeon]|jgi:hypothetical protein
MVKRIQLFVTGIAALLAISSVALGPMQSAQAATTTPPQNTQNIQSIPKIKVTLRQSESVSVEPGQDGFATAQCKKGEMVTGGGFFENDISGKLIVARSTPNGDNGWFVDAFNTGTNAEFMSAQVMCLKVVK